MGVIPIGRHSIEQVILAEAERHEVINGVVRVQCRKGVEGDALSVTSHIQVHVSLECMLVSIVTEWAT